MRKLAATVLANCLVVFAMALPGMGVASASASIATPPANPKVVIIVGPVAGQAAGNRSDADAAAAEAAKYTNNVVKVYTPNATWARAKAALQGASVVIYMGHGNGWPSPYAPYQTMTKDGIGLNPVAGANDSTTKYQGEYYLSTQVHLAPNAVVLMFHACYSAGNSEPGNPDPTLSVAKQRVDNFGAGWIGAGAQAVIAEVDGSRMWGGAAWYVRQLFTTHQSIDELWRSNPSFNDHVLTFPSVRRPGFAAEMDPDRVNAAPFHRSMVAHPSLQTQDVTGARYAATDGDPTSMVVPGAASAAHDGAGLYNDAGLTPDAGTGLAPVALPVDTRLRVDGISPAVNGAPVYAVHTLDGSRSGYMSGADLTPRDSQAPNIWTADAGTGAFSPNGDGQQDSFRVTGQISESADWTVDFSDHDNHVVHSVHGTGGTYDASWDGLTGGSPVPDGSYPYTIRATDGWGNPQGSRNGTAIVDTIAPQLVAPLAAAGRPPTFSPNGDGVGDSLALGYVTSEAGFIDVSVTDGTSQLVRHFPALTGAGPGSVSWLGDTDSGAFAADGSYSIDIAPRDAAGNIGSPEAQTVVVYASLSAVKASAHYFFPQDGDGYAKSTVLSFVLSHPATVTWTLSDAAGNPVYTRYDAAALEAGTYAWTWNGETPAGAYVPRGIYRLSVTATDGSGSWTQGTTVYADAFTITSSDATPARGEWVIVRAVSAEALSTSARLTISQPGHAAWTLTMTKASSTTYSARVHLYATGAAGRLVLKVVGHDNAGKVNSSMVSLTLD